jgi:hypothetical protein
VSYRPQHEPGASQGRGLAGEGFDGHSALPAAWTVTRIRWLFPPGWCFCPGPGSPALE